MNKTLAIILTLVATSAVADNIGIAHAANPTASDPKITAQTIAPGISPKAASGLVERGHAVIIDVREPGEVALIRIPGAINVPLGQLKNRLVELDKYRHSPVITQCRTGRRSKEAIKTLTSSGFTHVQNLEGGIVSWVKAGLKTERKCC